MMNNTSMDVGSGGPGASSTERASGKPGALAGLWSSTWQGLSPRERRYLTSAAIAVALLALWWLALQPAISTLRRAPAQLAEAQIQLQHMQKLAAEASELRNVPRVAGEQAGEALKQATEALGDKARLTLQGERATVTLNGVSQSALRDWLVAARAGARARPVEATLNRTPQGWSGNLVLQLGAAP